jgi:hypothetical protein
MATGLPDAKAAAGFTLRWQTSGHVAGQESRMPLLKVLTPEEAEKLGVPRISWVISPSMPKMKQSRPASPDSPTKPDQGLIPPDDPFFNGSVELFWKHAYKPE